MKYLVLFGLVLVIFSSCKEEKLIIVPNVEEVTFDVDVEEVVLEEGFSQRKFSVILSERVKNSDYVKNLFPLMRELNAGVSNYITSFNVKGNMSAELDNVLNIISRACIISYEEECSDLAFMVNRTLIMLGETLVQYNEGTTVDIADLIDDLYKLSHVLVE